MKFWCTTWFIFTYTCITVYMVYAILLKAPFLHSICQLNPPTLSTTGLLEGKQTLLLVYSTTDTTNDMSNVNTYAQFRFWEFLHC